jgi:hypothetical protein
LKYQEELTYEEMSEITCTTVGALKARYHHAVKKIEESQFNDNREAYLKEIRRLSDLRSGDISETDAKKRIEHRFELQRKIPSEEEKYMTDLSKVISYYQILKLNGLARDFTRTVYQKHRGGN